ncbi:hypothetical protein [Priestia filamentosa]|uniref:hypothetical protein n=1 Tax=Priestia filamentosa TaxID=1402861 RepID=UPI0002E0E62B|nr:hypothetical protein [Priestia filamentosa]
MKKITSITREQFKSITEDKRELKRFVKRPQNTKIEAQWSDLSPGKLSSLEENAVYLLQEGKSSNGKGKEIKPTVLMVSRDPDGKKIAYQSEVGDTFLQEVEKKTPLDYPKEMSRKYEAYLQAQKNENPEQTNTILDRIIAEQDYFTFKEDLVQDHGLSQEEVKRLERQVINTFHPGKEPTPEEKFKEAYKHQLQEALEEPRSEQTYKEQYKQEVLKQLGFFPSKEKAKEKEESKDKEKTTSGVQIKKETPEEREKRLQQMKEFESKQPFSKVYQLKKEVLKELKDLPLTDAQKAKLTHLEKALDQEKKAYDKEHSQEKGIKKLFQGVKGKKAAKKKRTEYELER